MDFSYSAADEAFRMEFRRWLEANLPPRDPNYRPDPTTEESEEGYRLRLEWHRKMHAAGWVGISWPKEYGGRGATLTQTLIYHEELLRARAPRLVNTLGIMMVGPTLMQFGTEEQKKRYIPKILSAEEIWCQGYSEPNAGSDVASLQTRAVEDGDYFIVNGQKVWTSEAHRADMCILLVRTDPHAPKHQGLSYLLVDMHSPGVTVRPLVQMTGARGFNEVFFQDVRVPKKNLVGEKNQGWKVAVGTLMFERVGIGERANMVGLVEELIALAQKVERDGRPAWEDPWVRQTIARFACEAEALRFTTYRQITRQLKGLPPGPEGSILKLAASELNLRISQFALDLLGPYSQLEHHAPYAVDSGIWTYRALAARGLTIAGGTSEIQRNIIGERVLGLPKG